MPVFSRQGSCRVPDRFPDARLRITGHALTISRAPEFGRIARQTGTDLGHSGAPLTVLGEDRIMRHLCDEVIV
jgi:hypothetical protein